METSNPTANLQLRTPPLSLGRARFLVKADTGKRYGYLFKKLICTGPVDSRSCGQKLDAMNANFNEVNSILEAVRRGNDHSDASMLAVANRINELLFEYRVSFQRN